MRNFLFLIIFLIVALAQVACNTTDQPQSSSDVTQPGSTSSTPATFSYNLAAKAQVELMVDSQGLKAGQLGKVKVKFASNDNKDKVSVNFPGAKIAEIPFKDLKMAEGLHQKY